MSPRPRTWWESRIVAEKLGYTRLDTLIALSDALIERGIIDSDHISRERATTSEAAAFSGDDRERVVAHGRGGRPQELVFMAPKAIAALASHAGTPEAARFCEEMFSLAMRPALPVVSADDTPEQVRELRARLESQEFLLHEINVRLAGRTSTLERRLDELEGRMVGAGVQLALPGDVLGKRVAKVSAKQQAFEELLASVLDELPKLTTAANGHRIRVAEILLYASCGNPAAVRLVGLAKANRFEASFRQAIAVGSTFRKLSGRTHNGRMLMAYGGAPCSWAVESVEEGAVH